MELNVVATTCHFYIPDESFPMKESEIFIFSLKIHITGWNSNLNFIYNLK